MSAGLDRLNEAQRRAVTAPSPLLVIAGAGSGKTLTLAHRVAHLLESGVAPARILLRASLKSAFPWCLAWHEDLRRLFAAYVEAKQAHAVLDYDDLLLSWFHLMEAPAAAARVRERFDEVLVDEYQDTSWLQAAVLRS